MNIFAEITEVTSAFGGQMVFLPDAGVSAVEVRHRGRSIIAHHAPDHPFSPSWVFIDPEPSHAHYYVHAGELQARLCWCRPDQFDPTFHLVVAVGCAMRFVNEELQERKSMQVRFTESADEQRAYLTRRAIARGTESHAYLRTAHRRDGSD